MQTSHRIARGLGWFSVGLGLTELVSGKTLDRYLGTGGHQGTLRLFGLRELAAGAIILAQKEPSAGSVWSRVGGDVMDLIFLGKALEEQRSRTKQERLGVATATVVVITALDVYCAWKLSQSSKPKGEAMEEDPTSVETSITLNGSPAELYQLWRDPQTLPQVMGHFATVTATADDRAHWSVNGPVKTSLQWDSQIVQEEPGSFVRWYSTQGAKIPNGGSIRFHPAPVGRGTVATLSIDFHPPGGSFGQAAAKVLGIVPKVLADKALRRFKSLAESGEIPTLKDNVSARTGAAANAY